uniref:Uncharacterized protein n=1 Tax=Acrobeloides nanus TaxID=290746 RepID=A0A914E469_9BILA
MLAVEELGFLKPNEDSSFVRPSMNPAESMQSIMSASSSYEKINGDVSDSQFLNALDEVKEGLDNYE